MPMFGARLLAVLLLLAPLASAEPRDDADHRLPGAVVDLALRQDAGVIVNPWNDDGLLACGVSGAGGRLVLDGRTSTASVVLDMAPEREMLPASEWRPAIVHAATRVDCAEWIGQTVKPLDIDQADSFHLEVAGPFTPTPDVTDDPLDGSIAATGTTRFGEAIVSVEGTVDVGVGDDAIGFHADLSAPPGSQWLLRIHGAADLAR